MVVVSFSDSKLRTEILARTEEHIDGDGDEPPAKKSKGAKAAAKNSAAAKSASSKEAPKKKAKKSSVASEIMLALKECEGVDVDPEKADEIEDSQDE